MIRLDRGLSIDVLFENKNSHHDLTARCWRRQGKDNGKEATARNETKQCFVNEEMTLRRRFDKSRLWSVYQRSLGSFSNGLYRSKALWQEVGRINQSSANTAFGRDSPGLFGCRR